MRIEDVQWLGEEVYFTVSEGGRRGKAQLNLRYLLEDDFRYQIEWEDEE